MQISRVSAPLSTLIVALSLALHSAGCTSLFKKTAKSPNTEPAPDSSPAPALGQESDRLKQFVETAIHPDGFAISDVRAIFGRKEAPPLESLTNCDFDYHAEVTISRNREELFMTLPEHIKSDPAKYHWCFYAKMLSLEDELSKDLYVDERQKILNKRYLFFVHVARVFLVDLEDPRYLEFSTANYKRLKSEFFRSTR